MRLIAYILLLIVYTESGFCISTDIYSETTYQSEKEIYTNASTVKLKNPIISSFSLNLLGGNEYEIESESGKAYDYSYTFLGAGLQFDLFGYGYITGEVRERSYAENVDNRFEATETRGLLVLAKYFPEISAGHRRVLFNEVYSETEYSDVDSHNIVNFNFVRSGLKFRYFKSFTLASFIEANSKIDKMGHSYNNLISILPTLRASANINKFTASFSLSYFSNQYLDSRIKNENPYHNKKDGYRLLFVLGGRV